jgi:hypothetical protein
MDPDARSFYNRMSGPNSCSLYDIAVARRNHSGRLPRCPSQFKIRFSDLTRVVTQRRIFKESIMG